MEYRHGIYGEKSPSGITVGAVSGTLPCYVGIAPVHQLQSFEGRTKIPIYLKNGREARDMIGNSENWEDYTLCEPLYVHFDSTQAVGPVIFINALDPLVHRATLKSTKNVSFIGGKGLLSSEKAILNTLTIVGESNLKAKYSDNGQFVEISGISVDGSYDVEFFEVDLTKVTEADIISAMSAVSAVYEKTNLVPSILLAPKYSMKRSVNDALKSAAKKINGHWDAFVFSDIDAADITSAIEKKKSEVRNSPSECPCFPMGYDGVRYYHLSTIAAALSQLVDAKNGNIPFETCSNKDSDLIFELAVKTATGHKKISFDITNANKLNASGIKTATFWAGKFKIWGPHTGAYEYGADIAPENIFDSSVRMMQFLSNKFQQQFGSEVDRPMHRARIDSILDRFGEYLDRLKAAGALSHGKIAFEPSQNPDSDIMQGQFVFDIGLTTLPPARSITGRFKYTADGIKAIGGGK